MSRSTSQATQAPGPRAARRTTLLRAAVMAVLLGPLTCSGIHDDELRCEEAVATLARCCPGYDLKRISCHRTDACGTTTATPQLMQEQSECIVARSCEELRRSATPGQEVCARALALTDKDTGTLLLCP